MAFQTALLPDLSVAVAEAWPSVANAVAGSWRASTPATPPSAQQPQAQQQRLEPPAPLHPDQSSNVPDFLSDSLPSLWSHLPNAPDQMAPCDIRSTLVNLSPFALAAAANPLVQRSAFRLATQPATGPLRRLFSTACPTVTRPGVATMHASLGLRAAGSLRSSPATRPPLSPVSRTIGLLSYTHLLQTRGFGNGGVSRSMLASLEAAANRNPQSATAQNAFYQVLLKANMPSIVVQRYRTGRYATNPAVDDAYAKAAAMLNSGGSTVVNTRPNAGLTDPVIQAATQAAVAGHQGRDVAISVPQGAGANSDGRIHVVVDDSLPSQIFKWVRFILVFAFICYFSMAVVSMIVESLNTIKRTGGARTDAEVKAENQKARFSDVHGCDEAKDELQELVEFLKNPEKFSSLGGKLPKGVLLVGPPGTGKTLLARAVAGEAGVPFFYMSGSEFDEIYVGVGAKRVRELFNAARAKSPAIIFIDELDAIGGKRNGRDSMYVKQTLNQLLTELDGFDQTSQVIIIAATNFPQSLDKALTRPGRFDRHVAVDLPDVRGRLSILKHHGKKVKLADDLNLQEIAQGTSGLSGAELENIINSAAIHASRNKSNVVGMKDLIWAKDKIIMGAEKKSMVISEKEKLMTAYHEAGHALMALYSAKQAVPLYKVTILPRGMSLGHTAFLPEMDKHSYTFSDFLSNIDTSLGGKVAEELIYGTDMVTSGASSDLSNATNTAFRMVAYFGMGSGLAPMDFGSRYDTLSPATRAQVENEVQRLLKVAYERTRDKLTEKRKELDLLAQALVDYETLDRAEVEKVIRGESLPDRIKMPRTGTMTVPITQPSPIEFPPIPGHGQEGESGSGAPPPPAPPAVA